MSTGRHRCKAEGFLLLALVGAGVPAPSSAQSISTISNLSFGSFIAGSGGTLAIDPGGARTSAGGVVGVGQGSTSAAASFLVAGTANASYTITLPTNGTVVLSDGTHTMALNNFLSSPPTGLLSGGGSQLIQVGATLIVGNGQPAGNYTGTFTITVNY